MWREERGKWKEERGKWKVEGGERKVERGKLLYSYKFSPFTNDQSLIVR